MEEIGNVSKLGKISRREPAWALFRCLSRGNIWKKTYFRGIGNAGYLSNTKMDSYYTHKTNLEICKKNKTNNNQIFSFSHFLRSFARSCLRLFACLARNKLYRSYFNGNYCIFLIYILIYFCFFLEFKVCRIFFLILRYVEGGIPLNYSLLLFYYPRNKKTLIMLFFGPRKPKNIIFIKLLNHYEKGTPPLPPPPKGTFAICPVSLFT
jgi:hypothetical protein